MRYGPPSSLKTAAHHLEPPPSRPRMSSIAPRMVPYMAANISSTQSVVYDAAMHIWQAPHMLLMDKNNIASPKAALDIRNASTNSDIARQMNMSTPMQRRAWPSRSYRINMSINIMSPRRSHARPSPSEVAAVPAKSRRTRSSRSSPMRSVYQPANSRYPTPFFPEPAQVYILRRPTPT